MRPLTLSSVICRHLLADVQTPQTVRDWEEVESDPEKRMQQFASQLRVDGGAKVQRRAGRVAE